MRRPNTREWRVVETDARKMGTYYHLNVLKRGARVTVLARSLPGPPYACLACNTHDCEHTRFVADRDPGVPLRPSLGAAPYMDEAAGAELLRRLDAVEGAKGDDFSVPPPLAHFPRSPRRRRSSP